MSLFDMFQGPESGLFADPATRQMIGLQMIANSGPSVGAPRGLFDDMAPVVAKAQAMQEKRREEEEERARREALSQALVGMPEFKGLEQLAQADPSAAMQLAEFRQPKEPELTTDMREYNLALSQGFEGNFFDYQRQMREAGRSQVNVNTGVKLPTGYRWIDPENQELGVEPIPGGPGEQISGEVAGRVGLAQDALTKLEQAEKYAKQGGFSGPVDFSAARGGYGDQGSQYREVMAGAEALTRMLTGAGMNIEEARREAQLYIPTWRDTPESAADKIAQLRRRLESVSQVVTRGRGDLSGAGATTGGANNDPLGIR